MVHAVVPAPSCATTRSRSPARCCARPASLLGLVKDNLNEAEDEVDRRRYLFANEAENQQRSVADIADANACRAAARATP